MPPDPIEHIIVTGANGYLGSHLVRLAVAQGRKITCLGRNSQQTPPNVRFARWELGDPLPWFDTPAERTAIIHLAHDWGDRRTNGANQRGTDILISDARKRRLRRFVFVSSQSARREALNAYGQIKWAIEQSLVGPDAVSARVGLVYGGARKGMYGLVTRLVSTLPVLPMIDPHRPVQPIHIDEVCRGLLALVDSKTTGWIGLAGPEPIRFGDFLKILAQEGFAASLTILPIPLRLALLAANASARIPFGPKIDKERILGLAGTQVLDCRDHLTMIGLSVVPLAQGLRRDVIGRKALLIEARVACAFILGRRPGGGLLRRYVRAIHSLEPGAGPIPLPRLALASPALLRFFEPFDRSAALAKRLRIAMALSEMSVDAVPTLDAAAQKSRLSRLWSMLLLIGIELLALPIRLLLARRA